MTIDAPRCAALFLAAGLLCDVTGCERGAGEVSADPPTESPTSAATPPLVRPSAGLLGPLDQDPRCQQVEYEGPQTRLYTDRPYHTDAFVPALAGHVFCRSQRHGRNLWLLEVRRSTTFLTLASDRHRLEAGGWERAEDPVGVAGAGLALDSIYRHRVEPGRYAIHYGHARTANPVFWNPEDVQVVPPATAGEH